MVYVKRGPFVNASPTGPYVDATFFNNIEAALAGTAAMAPAATGVVATDTTNLQNAISAAQAAFQDLYIPQGKYQLSAPLTWNVNKGSLRGIGDVILDWYNVGRGLNGLTPFTGPALTITASGHDANPVGNPLNHVGTKYVIEHFKLNGPDIDYNPTTGIGGIDGILFSDAGIGVDFPTVRHVQVYGMRDGLTYGDNTWSQSVERCTIHNPHRYGVNLTCGTNTGECTTLLNTSIIGAHNAAGNGVSIYAPVGSNVEFRMIGGSLDYSDIEGMIYGGALAFQNVHIEDNSTGPMFLYSYSGSLINVSFRDCAWDSSATAVRPYLHQVLPGSGSGITVTFDGDKGGLYGGTRTVWFMDSTTNRASGDLGIYSRIRGWALTAYDCLLGQHYNRLTNGDFGASSSFVASPGVGGWYAPALGTWSIGPGGLPGGALKLVATTAVTANTVQRVTLPASGDAVRVAGKMMVTSSTAGSIQAAVQFYAADGSTSIGGAYRIGSTLSTVDSTNWTFFARRFTPPPSAVYMDVQLGGGNFVGTGLWDEVEVVSV